MNFVLRSTGTLEATIYVDNIEDLGDDASDMAKLIVQHMVLEPLKLGDALSPREDGRKRVFINGGLLTKK